MKLVIDMNLSPTWVHLLARQGFEAVHWSLIGAPTAPDTEILTWARDQSMIVVTNDLDFSAILAATADYAPSVVQIRSRDLLSDFTVATVAAALARHAGELERGALLSIDESGTRARLLPLSRSTGD